VTDSMPAIALGMEPVEEGVMDERPKSKNEGIFAHGLGIKVVLQGCLFALLAGIAFVIGMVFENGITGNIFTALQSPDLKVAYGQTLAFMTLSLSQTVQAFNMRSERSLFKIGMFSNSKLNGAVLISVALVALVLFTPLHSIFSLTVLPAKLYLIGLGMALSPLVIMEAAKAIERLFKK